MVTPNDHLRLYNILRQRHLLLTLLVLCCHIRSISCSNTDRFQTDQPLHSLIVGHDYAEFLGPRTDHAHGGLQYEADFVGFGREIIGRASVGTTALENNIPYNLNIVPNSTTFYIFSNSSISTATQTSVRRGLLMHEREDGSDTDGSLPARHVDSTWAIAEQKQTVAGPATTVFVSINTCLQPAFMTSDSTMAPQQLTLYVSTTDQNQAPGPDSRGDQLIATLVEGYANITVNATGNVYIGVGAPAIQVVDSSVWNYEVAVSVDQPYHSFNPAGPLLKLLDSDASAALLVTTGLASATPAALDTTTWLQGGPPFSVFITNDNDTSVIGMTHSFCGLRKKSRISGVNIAPTDNGVQMLITTDQPGPAPEQEIYVPRLNATSTYLGFLAQAGNSSNAGASVPGGGGTVYAGMNFTTKRDTNCAVIYNLTFCSTVAYAVPSNPYLFPDLSTLANLYDGNASSLYKNFSYSLQQIACNTTATAQYSLVKTCDDCAAAYKTWLCAVTIPRCTDYSPAPIEQADPSVYSFLMPRNVAQAPLPESGVAPVTNSSLLDWLATNSSRNNDTIAGIIQPGPYRELLPCEDLCYNLVRSCPAALGFGCPSKGKGLEAGYGTPGNAADGSPMCSIPGAVYNQSGGERLQRGVCLMSMAMGLALFLLR